MNPKNKRVLIQAKNRMLPVYIVTFEMAKEKFLSMVNKTDSCWLYNGLIGKNGYGLVHYHKHPSIYAHRFSWMIHNGKIPDMLHVLHSCDIRNCVNPSHLRLGTQQDNMRDMKERCSFANHEYKLHPERIRNGQQLKCAKITKEQADEIRRLYVPRIMSTRKLAKKFNISQMAVMFILKNITYKNETYKRRLE